VCTLNLLVLASRLPSSCLDLGAAHPPSARASLLMVCLHYLHLCAPVHGRALLPAQCPSAPAHASKGCCVTATPGHPPQLVCTATAPALPTKMVSLCAVHVAHCEPHAPQFFCPLEAEVVGSEAALTTSCLTVMSHKSVSAGAVRSADLLATPQQGPPTVLQCIKPISSRGVLCEGVPSARVGRLFGARGSVGVWVSRRARPCKRHIPLSLVSRRSSLCVPCVMIPGATALVGLQWMGQVLHIWAAQATGAGVAGVVCQGWRTRGGTLGVVQ